jgi:acyl-CoA reductase-like NAD-dependent aldehyde dehydrogenase
VSAPGAGTYAGAPWFASIVKLAAAEAPDCMVSAVLDCGDQPGTVLAALRAGLIRVRFTGSEETGARLGEIAEQYGATVERADAERADAAPALDLLNAADPEAACRTYLARNSATG